MESGANEKDYKALLEKVGIEQFRERLNELIKSAGITMRILRG